MSSTSAVAPSSARDEYFRLRSVTTSFQQTSFYGTPRSSYESPRSVFDITKDGWVSSFDEDGNFLEVSFEASTTNDSMVLLMGGSPSEAALNQHFFPRMSINTRALSSIAPRRISNLKNPVSSLKNPMKRFSKRLSVETDAFDKEIESPLISSGKKRRRNKKLAKRMSKIVSKMVPKRFSQADDMEPFVSPSSRGNESAKKLKKKIWKRISDSPLMRKVRRMGSSDGAFPTSPWNDHVEVSSVKCAADDIGLCDFASVEEIEVDASNSSQRDDEVPASSTDETSDTSSGGSDEEAFTPNMVESTILYHDQRVPANWGEKDSSCKPIDVACNNTGCKDGEESGLSNKRIQEQLDVFNTTATFSCDLEELMKTFTKQEENRQRSHSACARTDSTEFADLKISCSNSTGGIVCPLGARDDDSISLSSAEVEELISSTSDTTPVPTHTPCSNRIKTIEIPKAKVHKSPPKSIFIDTDTPHQSLVRRAPSGNHKNGNANKKQFNYRANRKHLKSPTRLQMVVQAPSSPFGDLRKPRRRHSLKRKIKTGLQMHPFATTTVALSAVLFLLRVVR